MSYDTTGKIPHHPHLKVECIEGNWISGHFRGLRFEAKVFAERSTFGIDNGRVSKLWIKDDDTGQVVFNYDRGMDVDARIGRDLAALFAEEQP